VADASQSQPIEHELSRDLGLSHALAIGVGTMIAAGIFTLSGLAVGYVGSAAIAAFLLAAVVATFTALTYCEFTSIYPQSGEGYLYARKTFAPPLAYMVGWCLLLGYSASCGFYIASLSSYFNEFIWHSPLEQASGLAALVGLTLLNIKGTKESGSFQVIVTLAKVALLLWFVAGGISHVDTQEVIDKFSTDFLMIGSTAAMVFITFFGFSAIAASAGEVKNPTKTIPRAIFISMGIVTVLYSAVVLVVVAADLSEYSEAAMGRAAQAFLGSAGGMVIVAGAIFSMIAASNATIMAGSRVALAMSQMGHLPKEIGTINPISRTPVVAIVLVGAAIGMFTMILPLEELAHFADCVLLVALCLVNAALIGHRRKFPHIERPFKVPLVPLLPVLGIVANIYLLTQIPHVLPVVLAALALLVGFLGFLAWKGAGGGEVLPPGGPSRVALERSATGADESSGAFRVLVPIANPATAGPMIRLAASLAKPRGGEIVALRVVEVPEQLPPRLEESHVEEERRLLDAARAIGRETGVPVSALVRVGHSTSRAILETANQHRCDLIVIGWKGYSSTSRRILGQIVDTVVEHTRADILVARLVGDELPKRLLLPSAGGEHARRAATYAADLADHTGGALTLSTVIAPDSQEELVTSERTRLDLMATGLREAGSKADIDTRLIQHRTVVAGVLETSQEYDGIVLGAAGAGFWSTKMFGSVPEQIAREANRSVLVVKRYRPLEALVRRVMTE
jgi:basic amino acid/polyamine antiporter, APA family